MSHISGFERSQLLLLPEAVDDYVGSDNPVRFIDAFVDGLNLVEAVLSGFSRRRRGGRVMRRAICSNSTSTAI
jgi:transposase